MRGYTLKSIKLMLDSCRSKHMSSHLSHFSDFFKCSAFVWACNNECIPSYGVGTVRMITIECVVSHNDALQDVLYAPVTLQNLFSASQVQRNCFRVLVDKDLKHAMLSRMDLHRRSSGKVKMCGFETGDGFYETVGCVRLDQTRLTHDSFVRYWCQKL